MTSKISGQREHIWYGYKWTFHGFEKPQFCSQSKNVVTISLCRFYTRLSNTTMIKKNIWSSGETQKYLNLYREAMLRFRKKRQPFHKQKGSCIHFRIFIFILVLPPKIHFRLVGLFEIIEKNPLRGGGILLYSLL